MKTLFDTDEDKMAIDRWAKLYQSILDDIRDRFTERLFK